MLTLIHYLLYIKYYKICARLTLDDSLIFDVGLSFDLLLLITVEIEQRRYRVARSSLGVVVTHISADH